MNTLEPMDTNQGQFEQCGQKIFVVNCQRVTEIADISFRIGTYICWRLCVQSRKSTEEWIYHNSVSFPIWIRDGDRAAFFIVRECYELVLLVVHDMSISTSTLCMNTGTKYCIYFCAIIAAHFTRNLNQIHPLSSPANGSKQCRMCARTLPIRVGRTIAYQHRHAQTKQTHIHTRIQDDI